MFAIGQVSGTFSWPWCSSGVTLAPFPPQARSSIAAPASPPCGASWAGCRPTSRPAPPRRPRPSARHRRRPGRLRAARSRCPRRARAAPVAHAHRLAVRHRPPVATPRSGPGCALAGRRLARGADPAAIAVGRACRSPPPPAALGVAGAVARARPLQPRRNRSGLWRAQHRIPLDPPRRGALAPAQRHRPAVHHPAQKRSPLLPLHPLPRTWPSAHRCSTGKARAPPPRPRPLASGISTTLSAAQGCCCSCASNANRTAAPAAPPKRLCVWGLPAMKATKASGRWRFAGGWSGSSRRRGCR